MLLYESITYSECICRLWYAACKAHAPCYIFMRPVCKSVSYFFLNYLTNDTIFGKIIEHKICVLILSTNLSGTSLVLRRIQRDVMNVNVCIQSKCYSCPSLIKLQFSRQIFEEYATIKFYANPSSWSRTVLCGRADRLTDKCE